jgi:hypothetical protein
MARGESWKAAWEEDRDLKELVPELAGREAGEAFI